MFGKKEERVMAEPDRDINGYVGKGMRVEGKINFEGSVRIDGELKGEVSSDGTLLVGEGANLEAQIDVDTAVISGEINGVINARTRVELQNPARVTGDINTPTLIIGEGVIFEGNCVMTKRAAELKPVEIEEAGS